VFAILFIVVCVNAVSEAVIAFLGVIHIVDGTFRVVVGVVALEEPARGVDGSAAFHAVVRWVVKIKI
jgi:hypothetical protein